MNTPSNMAIDFDAKCYKAGKMAGGTWVLQLKLTPEQADKAMPLIKASGDAVWRIGAVRMDENEAPVAPSQPEDKKARREIWDMPSPQQAALLCDHVLFQNFLQGKVNLIVHDKDSAKQAIYQLFNIASRDLLPTIPGWNLLINEYRDIWEQQHYGDMSR